MTSCVHLVSTFTSRTSGLFVLKPFPKLDIFPPICVEFRGKLDTPHQESVASVEQTSLLEIFIF